jgi:amino acid transporter
LKQETPDSQNGTVGSERAAVRALGMWSLASVGLNLVVGAGFFLLPSQFFALSGAWSPWIILLVGAFIVPIALSFAEVGSRYKGNGGPYLYVRAAFGSLAGFELGWILWLSRIISHASVLSGLLVLLEVISGQPLGDMTKAAVVVGLTSVIGYFSVVGGDTNARLVTGLAVVKIAAVSLLIVVGLPQVEWTRVVPDTAVSLAQFGQAAVLSIFVISGFEMLCIPAGEASNPQRDVPRALLVSLMAGVALIVTANVVAIGLVPDLGASRLALADAGRAALGAAGWWMIAVAAVLAAVGNNVSGLLASSRLLAGLADEGDVPAVLGRRSARYGTPVVAVVLTAAVIIVLALSGSFVWLVGLASGTRVLIYLGVAISTARLRAPQFAQHVPPARFRTPAPGLVLVLSVLGSLLILTAMTLSQLAVIGSSLLVGLLLYAACGPNSRAGRGLW